VSCAWHRPKISLIPRALLTPGAAHPGRPKDFLGSRSGERAGDSLQGARRKDARRVMDPQAKRAAISPSVLVATVLASLQDRGGLLPGTLRDRRLVLSRFARYAASALGIQDADELTTVGVRQFVLATRADGSGPSGSDMYRRRAAVRLLYAEGRALGLVSIDPAWDISLPPRSSLRCRPLGDDEIELGRCWAVNSLTNLRRPLAWALTEAGAWTSEVAAARIHDVDLQNLRVWLRGTSNKDPRWAALTDWGAIQVERRFRQAVPLDSTAPIVPWRTRPKSGHAAASQAVKETLRASGLDREPDVRPRSIVAWRGRKLLEQGRDIAECAQALGYRSLDEAAAFLRLSWRREPRR
jgi:site-specific recombinase XerC